MLKMSPGFTHLQRFMKTLRENQSVVLEGETGSGKTTQVRNPSAPQLVPGCLVLCRVCARTMQLTPMLCR